MAFQKRGVGKVVETGVFKSVQEKEAGVDGKKKEKIVMVPVTEIEDGKAQKPKG